MKSLLNISNTLLLVGIVFLSQSMNAQNQVNVKKIDTLNITVHGVCDMCKSRIENAALIKGVKKSTWDKENQKLMVVYKPEKTNEENVHKAVAEAGHDTNKAKATDNSYEKLPKCCRYRDDVEVH